MGGNRKNGFLRGSAAGRNGFNTPKKFYCDACEKEHSASVEKTGLSQHFKQDTFVCDRQFFKMKDIEFKLSGETEKAIAKLKRLKPHLGNTDEKGLKARIEFICVVFLNNLKESLCNNDFFDVHNIGERDFDTCFEMHDGDLVVHGVVTKCKKNYYLKFMIKKLLSVKGFEEWNSMFENIESQNSLKGQQMLFT